jgi:thiol-disulfide isomerase/thioredoxin
MKIKLMIICLFFAIGSFAQNGIQFSHTSWNEAKAKAISEKKLLFIDFYTQWCGPCLMMQKDVFVLNSIGNYFNAHFINLKIDAENGEGIELAKKYSVKSFPTYCFIDPANENLVHESSSRQDEETFLFTAKCAIDPLKNSVYLNAQKKVGNNTTEFLINYANYQGTRYNRLEVSQTIDKLISIPGFSLENKEVWNLFLKNVNDRNNKLFVDFVKNRNHYITLYGLDEVDKKMFSAFQYCPDSKEFDAVPDFKGKDFLQKKNRADAFIRQNKYTEADAIIQELMAKPGDFKQEVCTFLFFTGRYAFMSKDSSPINYTDFWKKCCLAYMQYAVYNMPNREDIQLTYSYAFILEGILKSIPEVAKYLPDHFASPIYGAKEYSIRPAELKQKPTKK